MSDEELRLRALRAEIAARLRPVCTGWPPEVFETLVQRVAEITARYDLRISATPRDARLTEQLVAEMKELAERSAAMREGEPMPPLEPPATPALPADPPAPPSLPADPPSLPVDPDILLSQTDDHKLPELPT